MKTVKTPQGTILPITNLKGKDYMLVAHRIQWFNESEKYFNINTEYLVLDDEQTVCRATVTILNEHGQPVKRATATKRETKKDFSDHTEKAETGSLGRAVTLLGYGTQFALADLSEGDRIIDAPVVDPKELTTKTTDVIVPKETEVKTGFKKTPVVNVTKPKQDDGWQ